MKLHSRTPLFLALTTSRVAAIVNDFNFGDHAVDQCTNPIATITNGPILNVFEPRDGNGNCNDAGGICLGDCVRVVVYGGVFLGNSPAINVIVGSDLPDPGDCSVKAADNNVPKGWDFTHNGMCGKGNSGEGYWQNCFVHDVCVWARCTDDKAIPGGLSATVIGVTGGRDDVYCGQAYMDAQSDFLKANAPIIGCASDNGCPDPMVCAFGKCRFPRPEGDACAEDSDCQGYCELFKCYDGSAGDRCGKDSDCMAGLTCFGAAGTARCEAKRGEGRQCGSDSDCLGYCQMLRCWDGSKGDKCKRSSDCQSGKCRFRRCR